MESFEFFFFTLRYSLQLIDSSSARQIFFPSVKPVFTYMYCWEALFEMMKCRK